METPSVWSFRLKALLLGGFAAVLLAFGTVLIKWPFTKAKLIKMLELQSGRKVTIGQFESSYFPPGMKATDIRFLRVEHPEREPLIQVNQVTVNASWELLLTFGQQIPRTEITGMRLRIPPAGGSADGKVHELIPLAKGRATPSLKFGRLYLHDLLLEFLPQGAGAEPLRIKVRELVLSRAKNEAAFTFDALVENTLLKGYVHQKGEFGPWNAANPTDTPLKGTYTFRDGHMREIPGISGTLQAEGTLQGTLGKIELNGTASIPDFHVLRSPHTESLRSSYQAAVDAMNGDVQLRGIDVNFGRTNIHAEGRVLSKFAKLQAQVRGGRVEDLERLVMVAKVVPVSGSILLDTSIQLPPGPEPFLKRLAMAGHFTTTGESFANPKTQEALNVLAKSVKVESRMTANVAVSGGVARISDLMLTAPATAVRMDGTLNLLSQDVDFKGTLKTDGKLSETQSGFREFALKMVTPFLKKRGATVVAFTLKGKYGDVAPKIAVDGKRKL